MSGLIRALAEITIFLLKIIVDIICLVVFVVSLVGFWRWPFIGELHESGGVRAKLRVVAWANFGTVLLDIIVLPFFLITLCSWRVVRLCSRIGESSSNDFYSLERRGAVFVEFFLYLFDIPCFIFFIFAHCTFWCIPFLWSDIAKEIREKGVALLYTSQRSQSSEFRQIFALHALNGLVDIFLAPFALVVALTCYRIPLVRKDWGNISSTSRTSFLERKLVVCMHCLLVFVDLPFFLMAVLTLLLGIRAKALVEDIGKETAAKDMRIVAAVHFALSLRDWCCVVLSAPLVASIYRGLLCFKGVKDDVTTWADPTPALDVLSARLELPADRGTGLKVHLKVKRHDPSFHLSTSSGVSLYIRNRSFWKGVGRVMGGAVESLGQTMLPLSLAPKYLDLATTALCNNANNSDPFDVTIDFAVGAQCRTIRKNANKLFAEYADIQVQYTRGNSLSSSFGSSGTLFAFRVNFDRFDRYVDSQESIPVVSIAEEYDLDTRAGKRLCDVLWKHVLVQLGFLLFDIVALTFLILLHLFPHRVYRVYSTACEGPARRTARKRVEALHAFAEYLATNKDAFEHMVNAVDDAVRSRLGRIVSASDDVPTHNFFNRPLDKPSETTTGGLFQLNEHRWYPNSREFGNGDKGIQSLVGELDDRLRKLRDAGCPVAADALQSYVASLKLHALQVKEGYLAHYLREKPFCDGLEHMLGLSPEEQAVLEAARQEKLKKHAKIDAAINKCVKGTLYDNDLDAAVARSIQDEVHRATKERIAALYERYNPQRLAEQPEFIEQVLKHYEGREEELIAALVSKYGPEPSPTEGAESGDTTFNPETQADNSEQVQSLAALEVTLLKQDSSVALSVYAREPTSGQFSTVGAEPMLYAPVDETHRAPLAPSAAVAKCNTLQEELVKKVYSNITTAADDLSHEAWCGGKQGWAGVREVVVQEVGQLMYDTLTVLSVLFVLVTLYRIIPLVRSVRAAHNTRRACVRQVAEIGIDVLYIGKALLVLCFIRGLFTLPGDLFFYVTQKPSFTVARQVIDHHLRLVLIDLFYILSLVFAWDTIRFAVATSVFGVFSPCVVLESAFSEWDASGDKNERNLCFAAMMLVLSSAWVIGVPVFVGYYVGSRSSTDAAPAAVFYSIMLALLLLGLVVSVARREPQFVATQRQTLRSLTASFRHLGLAAAMVLELAQLLGLVFSTSRADIYGATIGGGLEQASNYVFATFGASWTSLGVPVGVYLALVLAIIFFVVSGAPVVCGDMLHWRKGSQLVNSPTWISAMEFFGQTCLLTVVRNIAILFVCSEPSGRLLFSDPTLQSFHACWSGPLRSLTIFAMVMLTYYAPMSLMKNQKLNLAVVRGIDVVYAQLYRILTQLPIAVTCVLCTLLYEDRTAVLSIVIACMVWCLLVTLLYEPTFHTPHCSVRTIGWYRFFIYGTVLLCAIVVLGHVRNPPAAGLVDVNYWSLYVCIAFIAALPIACGVKRFQLTRPNVALEDSIEYVKSRLVEVRKALRAAAALRTRSSTGDVCDKIWYRRLRAATRTSQLGVLVEALEKECYTVHLSQMFLATRRTWSSKLAAIIDDVDQSSIIDVDWSDGTDWLRYAFCCICCDNICSHESRLKKEETVDGSCVAGKSEEDRLIALQEVVMALFNASKHNVLGVS